MRNKMRLFFLLSFLIRHQQMVSFRPDEATTAADEDEEDKIGADESSLDSLRRVFVITRCN